MRLAPSLVVALALAVAAPIAARGGDSIRKGHVAAFDSNGKKLWDLETKGVVDRVLPVPGGPVLVLVKDWGRQLAPVQSRTTVGRAITDTTSDDTLLGIDRTSGKVAWQLGERSYTLWPCVSEGKLIVTKRSRLTYRAEVTARLDTLAGEYAETLRAKDGAKLEAILKELGPLAAEESSKLCVLDPATGRQRWEAEMAATVSRVAVADGLVFAEERLPRTTLVSAVSAFELETGKLVRKVRMGDLSAVKGMTPAPQAVLDGWLPGKQLVLLLDAMNWTEPRDRFRANPRPGAPLPKPGPPWHAGAILVSLDVATGEVRYEKTVDGRGLWLEERDWSSERFLQSDDPMLTGDAKHLHVVGLGYVGCFDRASGETIWKTDPRGARFSISHRRPTELRGREGFVATRENAGPELALPEGVLFLDEATGAESWRLELAFDSETKLAHEQGQASYLGGAKDLVFYRSRATAFGNEGKLMGFSARTGALVWETADSGLTHQAFPRLVEGRIFHMCKDGLECVESTTGKRVWCSGAAEREIVAAATPTDVFVGTPPLAIGK